MGGTRGALCQLQLQEKTLPESQPFKQKDPAWRSPTCLENCWGKAQQQTCRENGAGKGKNTSVAAILPTALQKSLSYIIKHYQTSSPCLEQHCKKQHPGCKSPSSFCSLLEQKHPSYSSGLEKGGTFATVELVGEKKKFSSCLRTAAHFKGQEFVWVSLHCSASSGRRNFSSSGGPWWGLCLCLPLLLSPGNRSSSSAIFWRWKQMKRVREALRTMRSLLAAAAATPCSRDPPLFCAQVRGDGSTRLWISLQSPGRAWVLSCSARDNPSKTQPSFFLQLKESTNKKTEILA